MPAADRAVSLMHSPTYLAFFAGRRVLPGTAAAMPRLRTSQAGIDFLSGGPSPAGSLPYGRKQAGTHRWLFTGSCFRAAAASTGCELHRMADPVRRPVGSPLAPSDTT